MIPCDELNQTRSYLLQQFKNCKKLKAEDMTLFVNYVYSVGLCVETDDDGFVDLDYIPAVNQGTISNTAGTNAIIPLATEQYAGLFSPEEKEILANLVQDGLVYPGVVAWTGVEFIYNVSQALIKLGGTPYLIDADQVTLVASDPTNPRIDVVFASPTGFGVLIGTPAAEPVMPQVDPFTQVFLTSIIVAAATTEPEPGDVTGEDIYQENQEYTGSFTGTGTVDFEDITNPSLGTYAIKLTNVAKNNKTLFNKGSEIQISTFDSISLKIDLNQSLLKDVFIGIGFLDASDNIVSNEVQLPLNRNLVNAYQFVAVQTSLFNFTGTPQKVYIQHTRTSQGAYNISYFIDEFKLQGGISQPTPVTEFKVLDDEGNIIFTTQNLINLKGVQFDAATKMVEISGFEKDGNGWRLIGRDPTKYRAIGANAVDGTIVAGGADNNYGTSTPGSVAFGIQNKISGGDHHLSLGFLNVVTGTWNNMTIGAGNTVGGFVSNFALGINNTVTQGYGSGAIGSFNTVNQNINGFGAAIGHNNVISDIATNALGTALISKSRYTVAVGVANTDYAETGNNAARPIFVVGTGTTSTPSGAWPANLRRDGFIVRHSGEVEAPELTTAKIDAGVGKTLVTKEWVTGEIPATPTLQEVLDTGNTSNDTALIIANTVSESTTTLEGDNVKVQNDNSLYHSLLQPTSLLFSDNSFSIALIPNIGLGIASNKELFIPNSNGTLATEEWVTAAIPSTPNLQQVTDEGNETTNDVVVKANNTKGFVVKNDNGDVLARLFNDDGDRALLEISDLSAGFLLQIKPRGLITSTLIPLDNVLGNYNATPAYNATYTAAGAVAGGNATLLIDTTGQTVFPDVTGATLVTGSDFEAGETFEMHVYTLDGIAVRYFFLKIS